LSIGSVPHWVSDSLDSSTLTGRGITRLSVPVPAFATIQRVIYTMACGGAKDSLESGNFKEIAALFLQLTIRVRTVFASDHTIHESGAIVPVSAYSLFDTSLGLPGLQPGRYFYGVYGAGDRELGQNLKVSFGGPAQSAAMTVYADAGLFQSGVGWSNEFNMKFQHSLRVLYYADI
jgi:hypothetical protein